MTTLDSSSAPESSMDEASNGLRTLINKPCPLSSTNRLRYYTTTPEEERKGDSDDVWETFSKRFIQVQSVLDRNRVLIKQVNDNHQSRVSDNLVKNVALIQELNNNVSKVASLYSDLSSNFSAMIHQMTQTETSGGGGKKDGATDMDAGTD